MASLFTLSPNSQVVELITRITSDPATTETLLVLPLTNSVGLLTITSPLSTITAFPTNTVSESANVLQNGFTTTSQGSVQNSTTTGVPPLANIPFSPSYSSLTAVRSNSQSVSPKATTDTSNPSSNRLTNGTVAGIVVAVAIGLALITFLLTFLIMRRRRTATSSHRQNDSSNGYALQSWKGAQQTSQRERKEPLITGSTKRPNDMPGYLKESADDSTVRKNVGTLLDQLDLHVENFYSDEAGSNIQKIDIAKVSPFETSKLSKPLVDSLKQTSEARLFIRHALTYYTTSAISCGDRTGSSLLPDEFTGLPRNLMRNDSKDASKSDLDQSISRWRMLTVDLRLPPSEDSAYLSQRDHRINASVETWSRAFAPWRRLKHKDEDQIRNLSAIWRSAAELGIWIFAQPTDYQFRWPEQRLNEIPVAPALIKTTDEKGQTLEQPQNMLEAVTERTK